MSDGVVLLSAHRYALVRSRNVGEHRVSARWMREYPRRGGAFAARLAHFAELVADDVGRCYVGQDFRQRLAAFDPERTPRWQGR